MQIEYFLLIQFFFFGIIFIVQFIFKHLWSKPPYWGEKLSLAWYNETKCISNITKFKNQSKLNMNHKLKFVLVPRMRAFYKANSWFHSNKIHRNPQRDYLITINRIIWLVMMPWRCFRSSCLFCKDMLMIEYTEKWIFLLKW